MSRSVCSCPVAVVGGAGFLGSHLVNHLIDDRGCSVLVVDNLVAGRREFIHPNATFVHHDITTSEEFLTKLFSQRKIRYVFNYAAYPYIPVSFERPLQVFNVNAVGAIKVINAAQSAGCEGILQVSSAEIYGDDRCKRADDSWGRITEKAPITPHSTYGVAKAAVDAYVQCAWKERQTPCIALRQFNCVGERETHPYVIPEIIGQLQNHIQCGRKEAMISLGNNSTRDFMDARSAVGYAVLLLENGVFGEVYNLGSSEAIKIYDLARLVGEIMGFSSVLIHTDPARKRPWEIWHLQSDNTKIRGVIGDYLSVYSLRESIERTVAWYQKNGCKWGWEVKA